MEEEDMFGEEEVESVEVLRTDSTDRQPDLDHSLDDFVEGSFSKRPAAAAETKVEEVSKPKAKKRKAVESVDSEDSEEGSVCTICFEDWSNSGDHRIASLKCGHFFGYSCIEKWLKGSGNSCPNCNEKNTRKDIRVHFVAKLAAIDTGERDRALMELEKERTEMREVKLRVTELNVRLKLQQDKIDQLESDNRRYRERGGELPAQSLVRQGTGPRLGGGGGPGLRLIYVRKHEVCRPSTERDKACRVLAFSEFQGMMVISQPSANPLFPGFGARRFNMLDQKLGNFVSLGRELIRDLAFHPVTSELMLSVGQEKVVRVTNMQSCSEVHRVTTDCEVWAADWSEAPGHNMFYLGTKRSQVLVHNLNTPGSPPVVLNFPVVERRPIISLVSVPACPAAGLNMPGLLVLTLGSLWFWEHNTDNTFTPHRLNTPADKTFWSLQYQSDTRLILLVCRPSPLASHIVMELTSTNLPTGKAVTANTIMTVQGGSYNARSFLRSCLILASKEEGRVVIAYTRGTGAGDIKVVLQEVPTGRIVQELGIGKPVLDIKLTSVNTEKYLAILGETDLNMYKLEIN